MPPSVPIGADPVRYWEAARDGRVFGYHKARTCVRSSGAPVVAIAGSAGGAWTVTSTGTVRGCGRASLGSVTATLRAPIVGIAPTASGRGYWLVASDGGIFSFGDARFWGSTGALPLNRPIVGMAASPTGMGYWLVASDGGIFSFGDARFWGSTAAMRLNSSVVGMAASPTGMGYWLVGSDGGVSPSVMRGSGVRRPRSA